MRMVKGENIICFSQSYPINLYLSPFHKINYQVVNRINVSLRKVCHIMLTHQIMNKSIIIVYPILTSLSCPLNELLSYPLYHVH